MVPDLTIFRAANFVSREHGDDAALEAAKHADAMLEKGNLKGLAAWKRIVRAVEEIRRTKLATGEATH